MKEITQKEWYKFLDEKRRELVGIVKWNDGSQIYYQNGKWHRTDGPAIIRFDNSVEYWIHGTKTTKEGQELYYSMMKLKGLI